MPRAKKPQLAKTVKDWSKRNNSIDIMFDRNALVFFAEFEGETFKHAEAAQVEKWCEEQFKSPVKVEWTPIITIWFHRDDRGNRGHFESEVKINFDRSYIGLTRSGLPRESVWDMEWHEPTSYNHETHSFEKTGAVRPSDDELRSSHMAEYREKVPFGEDRKPILPCTPATDAFYERRDKGYITNRVIAYTDEMWTGLVQLKAALDRIGVAIYQLVETDPGLTHISSVGEMLLGMALPAEIKIDGE